MIERQCPEGAELPNGQKYRLSALSYRYCRVQVQVLVLVWAPFPVLVSVPHHQRSGLRCSDRRLTKPYEQYILISYVQTLIGASQRSVTGSLYWFQGAAKWSVVLKLVLTPRLTLTGKTRGEKSLKGTNEAALKGWRSAHTHLVEHVLTFQHATVGSVLMAALI